MRLVSASVGELTRTIFLLFENLVVRFLKSIKMSPSPLISFPHRSTSSPRAIFIGHDENDAGEFAPLRMINPPGNFLNPRELLLSLVRLSLNNPDSSGE